MTDNQLDKAALRGEPSYVWRAGQARRMNMIMQAAGDLSSGRVLDNGCGVGSYLKHLSQHTDQAYGVEIQFERPTLYPDNEPSITREFYAIYGN